MDHFYRGARAASSRWEKGFCHVCQEASKSVGSNGETVLRLKAAQAFGVGVWTFETSMSATLTPRILILPYLVAARIGEDRRGPLFRSCLPGSREALQDRAMSRVNALKMIKRRTRKAELPVEICAHSFRGTGITEYLRNGGDLEGAARIAGHEPTRTTQLYNRLREEISLDEIERINI